MKQYPGLRQWRLRGAAPRPPAQPPPAAAPPHPNPAPPAALPRRLLDPKLATSYPSAILSRERAIIVNLEHIKMIVTMGAPPAADVFRSHLSLGNTGAAALHLLRLGRGHALTAPLPRLLAQSVRT